MPFRSLDARQIRSAFQKFISSISKKAKNQTAYFFILQVWISKKVEKKSDLTSIAALVVVIRLVLVASRQSPKLYDRRCWSVRWSVRLFVLVSKSTNPHSRFLKFKHIIWSKNHTSYLIMVFQIKEYRIPKPLGGFHRLNSPSSTT